MSKETIKNNGNNILKNEDNYFYIMVTNRKIKILSQSRDNSESKKEVILYFNTKIDQLIDRDESKYPSLYKLTIKKVSKQEKEYAKNSNIIDIGGPLKIILQEVKIKIKKNKISLKVDDNIGGSNVIFIDNKFLKKNDSINDKILKKISSKYYSTQINSFSLNKISHFN
mgnify:CR=1 FL=1